MTIKRLAFLLLINMVHLENAEDNKRCICVSQNLCADNDYYGEGNLDIRLDDGDCPNYNDICCDNPLNVPFQENHINKPLFKGCGLKYSNGLSTRITSDSKLSEFGELPWIVIIMKRDDDKTERNILYRCGGSIINPEVILTAAHCVNDIQPNLLVVRAGEWDTKSLDEPIPHQDLLVKEVVVHPQYHNRSLRNDIALLILSEPIEMKQNIGIICLPPQGFKLDNVICTAGGWGKDAFKLGKHSSILKKVNLPLVNNVKCLAALKKTRLGAFYKLHPSFVCAGGVENQDTCKGDGGSPLVCPIPGIYKRFFQMGIVSWGIGCGENETPGVYVYVPLFTKWIEKQIISRSLDSSLYKYGIV